MTSKAEEDKDDTSKDESIFVLVLVLVLVLVFGVYVLLLVLGRGPIIFLVFGFYFPSFEAQPFQNLYTNSCFVLSIITGFKVPDRENEFS